MIRIHIGNDRKGVRFGFVLEKIRHIIMFGGSGVGKSFLLLHAILEVLRWHRRGIRVPLVVVDSHSSLFSAALAFVKHMGLGDRTIVFRPDPQAGWTPTLNPLASPVGPEQVASAVAHAIHRAVQDADESIMTRVKRYLNASIHVLQATGLTLVEAFEILRDKEVREHLLPRVTDYYAQAELSHLDEIPDFHRVQRIESTEGRLSELVCTSATMRRILGAATSTVSMDEVLARGFILLVDLSLLTHQQQCMVSALLTDALFTAAMRRTPDTGYHALAILDEAASYISGNPDLSRLLDEVRKRRLHLWLCLQHLGQIQLADPLLYSSAVSNCDIKLVFGGSRQDSEQLVGEMFHDLGGDEVRQEIYRLVHRFREETRTIRGRAWGSAESSGSTNSVGAGSVQGYTLGPQADLPSFTWADSGFNGQADSSAYATTQQDSEVTVPFLNPIEDRELASREHRSVEQLKEIRIAWLQAQPDRHFWAAFGRAAPPVALRTPDVRPVHVPETVLHRFLEHLYARHGCAVRAEQIDRAIEARRLTLRAPLKIRCTAGTTKAPKRLPSPGPTVRPLLESPTDQLLAAAKQAAPRRKAS